MNFDIKPSESGEYDTAIIEISDWLFGKSEKLHLIIRCPSSEKQYLAAEGWSASIQKNLVFASYDYDNICRFSIGPQLTKSLQYATNYLFIVYDLHNNELVKFGRAWRGLPSSNFVEENTINLEVSDVKKFDAETIDVLQVDNPNPFSNVNRDSDLNFDSMFPASDITQNYARSPLSDTSFDNLPKELLRCRNSSCGGEFYASLESNIKIICKWCGKPF